ncbi:MAG TPA: hypothetical protein VFH85_01225 [Gammaproteobacteria bacterium]|nr:hypothetical protein [Gammaproteobacteria bacterium]
MKLANLFRIAGAAAIATLLVVAVTSYIVAKTRRPAHQVLYTVVKGIQKMPLGEVNGVAGTHFGEAKPKPKKLPPPPAFLQPKVSGIVQVAYTVQPDGSATDIRVTGAAPKGYYEKQAMAIIANSYHRPEMGDDHKLHPHSAATIIHFTVPRHGAGTATAPRSSGSTPD